MELDGIEMEATRVANGTNRLGINEVIDRIEKDKVNNGKTYSYQEKVSDSVFLTLYELESNDVKGKFEYIEGLDIVIKNFDSFKKYIDEFKNKPKPKSKIIRLEEMER